MVDALVLGTNALGVQVQVLSPAPKIRKLCFRIFHLCRKAQHRCVAHATSFSRRLTSFCRRKVRYRPRLHGRCFRYCRRHRKTPHHIRSAEKNMFYDWLAFPFWNSSMCFPIRIRFFIFIRMEILTYSEDFFEETIPTIVFVETGRWDTSVPCNTSERTSFAIFFACRRLKPHVKALGMSGKVTFIQSFVYSKIA